MDKISNSVWTENLARAKESIAKFQQNLINFLEKGDTTPIKINDFMTCYNDISAISGKIKGEDESAAKLFSDFIHSYITQFILLEKQEHDGEEYLDFLIKKWNNFKIFLFILEKIFFKIDKFKKNKTLMCMAFDLLKSIAFDQINEKVNKILICFIEQERNDQYVPQNKILTVINVIYFINFFILKMIVMFFF